MRDRNYIYQDSKTLNMPGQDYIGMYIWQWLFDSHRPTHTLTSFTAQFKKMCVKEVEGE